MTLKAPLSEAALINPETNIEIEGVPDLEAIQTGTITICRHSDVHPLSAKPLKVMVMPKRTVSLGVYYLIDTMSSGTLKTYDETPTGDKVLSYAPTAKEVETRLNEIYKQAGIEFKLESGTTGLGCTPATPFPRHYDENNNGRLDASERESSGFADVVLLSGSLKVFVVKYGDTDGLLGVTHPRPNTLSYSFIFPGTIHAAPDSAEHDGTMVAAHEVGHVLGLEHDTGEFPPESQETNGGLMKPGKINGVIQKQGKWLRVEDEEDGDGEGNNGFETVNLKARRYGP